MATEIVRVRSITDTTLEYDMVAIENRGRIERYPFKFSPKDTVDESVVETEVDEARVEDFIAAVTTKVGVVIPQNPLWDDVKTDTDDDGVNDTGEYNWATYGLLYEIVEED